MSVRLGNGARSLVAVVAVAGFVVAVGGCTPPSTIPSDLAARVAGEELAWHEVRARMADLLGDDGEAVSDARVSSRLLDQLLDQRLLERLALDRGLDPGRVDDARRVVEHLLGDGRLPATSRAEAEAYFESHRDRWKRPERVRVRQILVESRELADEAHRALEAGEEFAEVAETLSEEPLAHLGGDQGLLAREDLPKMFSDVLFDLEPGEISPIVPAEYGFHVFQVVERRPAEEMAFEEVAPEIVRELDRRRIDAELERLVAVARDSYDVRVFRANLPFDYRGEYPTEESEP